MQQKTNEILNQLYDELANAKKGFGQSKVINADVFADKLTQLRTCVEEETQQSAKIAYERQRILDNAYQNANRIENDAREKARQLIEEHQITVQANIKANKILADADTEATNKIISAQNEAKQILSQCTEECLQKRNAIKDYIRKSFNEYDTIISGTLEEILRTESELAKNIQAERNIYNKLYLEDQD